MKLCLIWGPSNVPTSPVPGSRGRGPWSEKSKGRDRPLAGRGKVQGGGTAELSPPWRFLFAAPPRFSLASKEKWGGTLRQRFADNSPTNYSGPPRTRGSFVKHNFLTVKHLSKHKAAYPRQHKISDNSHQYRCSRNVKAKDPYHALYAVIQRYHVVV